MLGFPCSQQTRVEHRPHVNPVPGAEGEEISKTWSLPPSHSSSPRAAGEECKTPFNTSISGRHRSHSMFYCTPLASFCFNKKIYGPFTLNKEKHYFSPLLIHNLIDI